MHQMVDSRQHDSNMTGMSIEYRQLGKSGLTVSNVGLGCNNLGRAKTATETQAGTNAVLTAALEAGITLFDVADIYEIGRHND